MRQNELERLREASLTLKALPDGLISPGPTTRALPVAEATLDDLAINIMETEAAVNATSERLRALRRLYDLAHAAGATGRDLALAAATRGLE